MNFGKALAVTAVTGMLAAMSGACGDAPGMPKVPSTDIPNPTAKDCCKGKNECKGKSGCKTESNASCAGKNECKGKGTSCPKG